MKKIHSYALFGNHAHHGTRQFYWDHLPALVRAHHNFYPDWELRIHVDSTYHEERSAKLRAYADHALCTIVHCGENEACCKSMLWRMKPLWDGDPDVAIVMCRDIDSAPCPRDYKAIMQFIESGAAVHTINDNYQHTERMMGGMVGFNAVKFREKMPFPTWEAFVGSGANLEQTSGGHDQILMSHVIWDHFYPDICSHRFAGMPFDGNLTACHTQVPDGPIDGLDPEMCAQADTLMPYLGASSYEIPRACKIYDTHGNPEVRERVKAAEEDAK